MSMLMNLSESQITEFQKKIWAFYAKNKRYFAWREQVDPYRVTISEVMLQQTQTHRVIAKFEQWLRTFPSFDRLARSSLCEVLQAWQGLGYNRRAKYLHEMAKIIVAEHNGKLPADPEVLVSFPGIGQATAASICAFAYNMPTVFIETNIRAVFLYHFFQKQARVYDREMLPLVAQTLPQEHPREWYYALMDYGVTLKKKSCVNNCKSAHYTKQSVFEGSDRQLRGRILKLVSHGQEFLVSELGNMTNNTSERVNRIISDLCQEGFLFLEDGKVFVRE